MLDFWGVSVDGSEILHQLEVGSWFPLFTTNFSTIPGGWEWDFFHQQYYNIEIYTNFMTPNEGGSGGRDAVRRLAATALIASAILPVNTFECFLKWCRYK